MKRNTLHSGAALGWATLAIAAALLLPWYAMPDAGWLRDYPAVFGDPASAPGWLQASRGRFWLWLPLAAPLAALLAPLCAGRRQQGLLLAAAGGLGLAGLLGAGFAIGPQGWVWFGWQDGALALPVGQPGLGWGGALTLLSLLMLLATGVARLGYFQGNEFVSGAVVLCSALLILFIAAPVLKSLAGAFLDEAGRVSAAEAWSRLASDRIWNLGCLQGRASCGVAWNTLALALATAAGTTVLGTLLALLTERSLVRARPLVRVLSTLPIVTPPFVVGLGLILLFGRAGLVNQGLEQLFGIEPSRWFYSAKGVWLAQMIAFTPIAYMMMRSVAQSIAPTLEEAAQTLRAQPMRAFMTVTLPLLGPGLANAFLVGFIESMADFGNPIVVGGQFAVLSTEIFFAIVGAQLDQGRAAALALVLSAFALAVFVLQRMALGKGSYTSMSGKGDNGIPPPLPAPVRRAAMAVAMPWLAFTAVIYLFAFAGGFVKLWGRDFSFTLQHFHTAFGLEWDHGLVWLGAGWDSLWTTLRLAGMASPLTALLGLLMAYLLARVQFRGRGLFEFGALLAFAVPGTVLGVAYVLAFNVPPFELTGTGLIILLCFVFRNLPVSIRAGTAALKQIDKSLDEASSMLGASTVTTMRRVMLPLLRPALVASLVYGFVRAMTTVSSVIFLVSAEYELATTFIIGRVGNGEYGVALAYCTVLTVLMLSATAMVQWLVGERKLGRRAAATADDKAEAAPAMAAARP
ncbi:ABC transporter permease [Pseudoduganella namucuonensis]|uniref:Iron(III) transport system permease protein n=1 Tax=Pseudoduganella namucuonensis TaxID=1035707 RepID=A0A1I7LVW7_9BURK|nr:iron ABC transporter permease [Pseudoduganella namucuonensis]SFV13799.1 iron(III) transport system permease protein [Pseudoduganella namucuonensis]